MPLYETAPSFLLQQDVRACKPALNFRNYKFVCVSVKHRETNGYFSIEEGGKKSFGKSSIGFF